MNYDKEMQKIVSEFSSKPSLLLHSCCGPCSSYVINYLKNFFSLTIFFYNPCIWPDDEYYKRLATQKEFLKNFSDISLLDCEYDSLKFFEISKNLENEVEGGARCNRCFFQRLEKTFLVATSLNFDFFCTTLTVSPHKNSDLINKIGMSFSGGSKFLVSDFKKNNGYFKSVLISKENNLYRQDYCGCKFSKIDK